MRDLLAACEKLLRAEESRAAPRVKERLLETERLDPRALTGLHLPLAPGSRARTSARQSSPDQSRPTRTRDPLQSAVTDLAPGCGTTRARTHTHRIYRRGSFPAHLWLPAATLRPGVPTVDAPQHPHTHTNTHTQHAHTKVLKESTDTYRPAA